MEEVRESLQSKELSHNSNEPRSLLSLNSYHMSLEKRKLDKLKEQEKQIQKASKSKRTNSTEKKLPKKASYSSQSTFTLRKVTGSSRKYSNEPKKKNSLTRFHGRIKGQNTESTMCSAQEMPSAKFYYTPESLLHSQVIKSKRPATGKRTNKQQVILKRQLTAKFRTPNRKAKSHLEPPPTLDFTSTLNKSKISVVENYQNKHNDWFLTNPPQIDRRASLNRKSLGDKNTLEAKIKRMSSNFSQSNVSGTPAQVERNCGTKPTLRIKKLNKNQDWPYLDTSISNVAILEASPISKELIREYRRTIDSFRTPKTSSQRKNPINVNKLLNLQLSASSLASHKWGSQTTKSRIEAYHVTSPDIEEQGDSKGSREHSKYASVRASIQPEDASDIYLSNKCINHQIYNQKLRRKTRNLGSLGQSRRKLSPSVNKGLKDDDLPLSEREKLRNVLNLRERDKMLDSFIKRVQKAELKDKVIFGRKWSEYSCQEKVLYEILKKKEQQKKKQDREERIRKMHELLEKEKEVEKEKNKTELMGHSRELSQLSISPRRARKQVHNELKSLFATTPQKVPNSGLLKV